MKYLVDSDWLIDSFSGITSAVDAMDRLAPSGIAVSAIVLCEIYEGAHGSADVRSALERIKAGVARFAVLPVDEPVAETFAGLRPWLERRGNRIEDMDLLIASTALVHELTLITRNRRHFERIPGLLLYVDIPSTLDG